MICPMLLSACATTAEGAQAPSEQALRQKLQALAGSSTPGLQYTLVGAEGVLFHHSAGHADIHAREAVGPDSRFMAYSLTKTFTAAAVLRLAGEGKLGLDDPLSRYVPESPYGPDVRIRHLLAQTSGIPDPIPLKWVHLASEHATFDEAAALDAILKEHPKTDFEPGRKYGYSNISYWLLGRVIERASGQSYVSYMSERIFGPLGMEDRMNFDARVPTPAVKGYIPQLSLMNFLKAFVSKSSYWGEYEDGWLHIQPHYLNGPAFGGLVTSANGVARFLQDQLAKDSVILSREMRARFQERQSGSDGKPVPMTLGWHVDELDGVPYLYKEGGGMGFHAEMRLYPSLGRGSVILVNSGTFNSRKTLSRIDRIALRAR